MTDQDQTSSSDNSFTSTRRHAAIMFTDIVGYTALMGSDEDSAFETLRKNREVHSKLITQFNGTLVKEIGDGMLISFHLSSEAVRCAIEIQKACKKENIPLKIGIHEGEVVIEGTDVLGDNVNIASRLQDNTGKGNINISESVYRNIRNKADIKTVFLEEKHFKNVQETVKVYRIISGEEDKPQQSRKPITIKKFIPFILVIIVSVAALLIWQYGPESNRAGNVDSADLSIAVLPFVNMSNEPDQEYFSDGMTEEIIVQLAKIGQLSVISRTSVFKYKNKQIDLKTIGKELGVSYIMEGSVRRENDRLRITTQLINAGTDKNIWSEIFDREQNQVLDIQSEVAKQVADVLGIRLSTPEIERIDRKSTKEYTAYEYYLKAIHEEKKWTQDGSYIAIEYLEKAIALDPEFSEAYSLLAWQYIHLSSTTQIMSSREALRYAKPAIIKAVELDPQSSDAFLVYGAVNFYLEWNFEEAKRNFEKSMELNSWGEAPIYQCICAYVEFLMANNYFTETWELFEKIQRIDPSFFQAYDYESLMHISNNDTELALETFEKRLAYSDSLNWVHYSVYGSVLYHAGKYEEAANKLEQGLSLDIKRNPFMLSYLSMALLHTGKEMEALEILEELLERQANKEGGLNGAIAIIYNELENEEKTFEYLDKAYKDRESFLVWMKVVHFKNLDDHPRYQALLEKIGFEV